LIHAGGIDNYTSACGQETHYTDRSFDYHEVTCMECLNKLIEKHTKVVAHLEKVKNRLFEKYNDEFIATLKDLESK